MSTDVALRQPAGTLEDMKEQVRLIEQTEFVPKALRGNKHAILACVLYGRELGLGPMQSLEGIHMIDGRPSLAAATKLKRAREAGHSITGESSDERASVTGTRADNGDSITVTFTIDDAKRANLLGKDNWKKYPADMLWARAVSRLCRRLFDDVPGALMHDPDEVELTAEDRVSEQVGAAFTPMADDFPGGRGGQGAVTESASPDAGRGAAEEPLGEEAPTPAAATTGDEGPLEPEVVDEGEQSQFAIPQSARRSEDQG